MDLDIGWPRYITVPVIYRAKSALRLEEAERREEPPPLSARPPIGRAQTVLSGRPMASWSPVFKDSPPKSWVWASLDAAARCTPRRLPFPRGAARVQVEAAAHRSTGGRPRFHRKPSLPSPSPAAVFLRSGSFSCQPTPARRTPPSAPLDSSARAVFLLSRALAAPGS